VLAVRIPYGTRRDEAGQWTKSSVCPSLHKRTSISRFTPVPSGVVSCRPALLYVPSELARFLMALHTSFLKKLTREKAKLNESDNLLSDRQGRAFRLCCDLLRENAASLATRSKSRRSVRLRARSLLADVFTSLGPEVFLLSTLGTSISDLATIPTRGLIPELRGWWKAASHSKELTELAHQACDANSISSLAAGICKLRLARNTNTAGKEDSL
jgi:hypothetical protein